MQYNLKGKVAVVTGGGGSICGEIAKALATEGVRVAIWDIDVDSGEKKRFEIEAQNGRALSIYCNTIDKMSVEKALAETMAEYKTVDILVNGTGGSRAQTTTSTELDFFDIEVQAMKDVIALNYLSAVIPSQVVGKLFAAKEQGVILNISSIAGFEPLGKALSYSNGKAATNSFTQWLAVHMAQNYSTKIRVNALAPGFVLTDQNSFLLIDKQIKKFTERTQQILMNTPMARLGKPEEIAHAALWLVSDQASFVTGTIIPVDGGFTAFSGV